ncbi:MAG: alpha/beta hydrolase [Rhodocyclaceae bacterium]|jgi:pimeloyl-ACP methyl ester carboxylesterase|nr:alpha/beta hydrolase [Rhodocyclaceae bacterium]MBK9312078.1 alpha/beta hydrolase [Rhodocyclaceae bacterium]
MNICTIDGRRIEYVRLPSSHPRSGAPAMVFLHEGLGSLSMWRDFPQQLADACGCEAIVYSRHGYGRSDPLTKKRTPAFMHHEARVCLPQLLDQLGLDRPILFGHSDGASIALIHAGGTSRPLTATVVMAPHVLVEDISIRSIRKARDTYLSTDLKARLAKYHADPDSAFWGWNDIWLDPAFRDWNIEDCLPGIVCPLLAIQGEDDEYGTMDQIERIARRCRDVELVKLADCRHSPYKDQPRQVIATVAEFVARILD